MPTVTVRRSGSGSGKSDYKLTFGGEIESTSKLEFDDNASGNVMTGTIRLGGEDIAVGPYPIEAKNLNKNPAGTPPDIEVEVDGETKTMKAGETKTFDQSGSNGVTWQLNDVCLTEDVPGGASPDPPPNPEPGNGLNIGKKEVAIGAAGVGLFLMARSRGNK